MAGRKPPLGTPRKNKGCFLKFTPEEAVRCEVKSLVQGLPAVKSGFGPTGDLLTHNPGSLSPPSWAILSPVASSYFLWLKTKTNKSSDDEKTVYRI